MLSLLLARVWALGSMVQPTDQHTCHPHCHSGSPLPWPLVAVLPRSPITEGWSNVIFLSIHGTQPSTVLYKRDSQAHNHTYRAALRDITCSRIPAAMKTIVKSVRQCCFSQLAGFCACSSGHGNYPFENIVLWPLSMRFFTGMKNITF